MWGQNTSQRRWEVESVYPGGYVQTGKVQAVQPALVGRLRRAYRGRARRRAGRRALRMPRRIPIAGYTKARGRVSVGTLRSLLRQVEPGP